MFTEQIECARRFKIILSKSLRKQDNKLIGLLLSADDGSLRGFRILITLIKRHSVGIIFQNKKALYIESKWDFPSSGKFFNTINFMLSIPGAVFFVIDNAKLNSANENGQQSSGK